MILSKHPWAPFVPDGATKLIIGTIPPYRFCVENGNRLPGDTEFYYGSRYNSFWNLLHAGKTIDEWKLFLVKHRIGITDIINTCIHMNGSALNDNLSDIKYKDIASLLEKYPSIDTLLYNCGFIKHLIYKANNKWCHKTVNRDNREYKVKIGNKEYKVIILYSPSPNALRGMGKNGVQKRQEQYNKIFNT